MSRNKPLKLKNNSGELQRLSSTEENYLAYQAGLQLSTGTSTDVGAITLTSTGNGTVGTFSDTAFNVADGTHPATSITSTTTQTTLYQTGGTADESGADFRRPVGYQVGSDADNVYDGSYNPVSDADHSNDGIHEMDDAALNALVDRINSRIAASDYPGVYKLGSSSPGADYTVHISGVFSDTINTGTVTNYNIYKRTAMSAPTTVKSLAIKRSSGKTGTYEGLVEMSDAQIKYTFGQRAKTLYR